MTETCSKTNALLDKKRRGNSNQYVEWFGPIA